MSALTEKYGDVYILAQRLGATNLTAVEENGRMVIGGTLPTRYAASLCWNRVKEIDPELQDGDLTMKFAVSRQDIYGEYQARLGDNLAKIARKVSGGKLTDDEILQANYERLPDPNYIEAGQVLIIPNFS